MAVATVKLARDVSGDADARRSSAGVGHGTRDVGRPGSHAIHRGSGGCHRSVFAVVAGVSSRPHGEVLYEAGEGHDSDWRGRAPPGLTRQSIAEGRRGDSKGLDLRKQRGRARSRRSQQMHQGIYVRRGSVGGRRFEVAKEELMGMFGSRRTKTGVSKRRRGCNRQSLGFRQTPVNGVSNWIRLERIAPSSAPASPLLGARLGMKDSSTGEWAAELQRRRENSLVD